MIDLIILVWQSVIDIFDSLSDLTLTWSDVGSISLGSFILAVMVISLVVGFLQILIKE